MHALAAASSGGGSPVPGFVLIAVGVAAYWVPSIVAGIRQVPHLGSVIIINLFLGWTVIGWIVALAMACRSRPQQVTYVPGQPGSGRP